jgi:hypothetical protein
MGAVVGWMGFGTVTGAIGLGTAVAASVFGVLSGFDREDQNDE